ncbi:hypothetical protein [Rickettsia asembonensis]|uniref:hypothetical protein n=1 Tax=Rickettsia asembonensis TaxID=1068590 RepID=UPI000B23AE84
MRGPASPLPSRGLTTVSKKQLKVPIILVFLTGSRVQATRDDTECVFRYTQASP